MPEMPLFVGNILIKLISCVKTCDDNFLLTYVMDEEANNQYRQQGIIIPKMSFLFTLEESQDRSQDVGKSYEYRFTATPLVFEAV